MDAAGQNWNVQDTMHSGVSNSGWRVEALQLTVVQALCEVLG